MILIFGTNTQGSPLKIGQPWAECLNHVVVVRMAARGRGEVVTKKVSFEEREKPILTNSQNHCRYWLEPRFFHKDS